MKYGDFSTLVQLGVGLHVGTALLQLYGEIGVQPLIRTIARIRSLIDDNNEAQQDLAEELTRIETDFEIFRIRLFNAYKLLITINSLIAIVLVVLLIIISYNIETPLPNELSVFFVAFSVLPAPSTLGILWYNASKVIRPLKGLADNLEQRALRAHA
jgi:hypothetical protein